MDFNAQENAIVEWIKGFDLAALGLDKTQSTADLLHRVSRPKELWQLLYQIDPFFEQAATKVQRSTSAVSNNSLNAASHRNFSLLKAVVDAMRTLYVESVGTDISPGDLPNLSLVSAKGDRVEVVKLLSLALLIAIVSEPNRHRHIARIRAMPSRVQLVLKDIILSLDPTLSSQDDDNQYSKLLDYNDSENGNGSSDTANAAGSREIQLEKELAKLLKEREQFNLIAEQNKRLSQEVRQLLLHDQQKRLQEMDSTHNASVQATGVSRQLEAANVTISSLEATVRNHEQLLAQTEEELADSRQALARQKPLPISSPISSLRSHDQPLLSSPPPLRVGAMKSCATQTPTQTQAVPVPGTPAPTASPTWTQPPPAAPEQPESASGDRSLDCRLIEELSSLVLTGYGAPKPTQPSPPPWTWLIKQREYLDWS